MAVRWIRDSGLNARIVLFSHFMSTISNFLEHTSLS